jgi:hypothetical protein
VFLSVLAQIAKLRILYLRSTWQCNVKVLGFRDGLRTLDKTQK